MPKFKNPKLKSRPDVSILAGPFSKAESFFWIFTFWSFLVSKQFATFLQISSNLKMRDNDNRL